VLTCQALFQAGIWNPQLKLFALQVQREVAISGLGDATSEARILIDFQYRS
jgi:hypothetical protein